MFGFQWLAKIRRNEKGNVLFIGAACMPLFLGAAGLAVDTVQLALWKRQIQRAADSAAIAGALTNAQKAALTTGVLNDLDEHISFDVGENEVPPLLGDPVIREGSYAAGVLSAQNCSARAEPRCFDDSVQVELTAQKIMPFMSLFTGKPNIIKARATAAIDTIGDYCLVSLHDQNSSGISVGGNSTLGMNCGLATNARGASAVRVFGSAEIVGSPVAAVGGITGQEKFAEGTKFEPYSSPISDPFESAPDPVLPGSGCQEELPSSKGFSDSSPMLVQPNACFTNWNIDGSVKLTPNSTYYVNNGLFDLKGTLTGENVTIIFMGDNSDWKQNAQSTLDISAPKTGDYKNIAIYRERTAAVKQFKINGGAGIGITGAIYGKTTDLWLGGNASFTAECLQVVGRVIEFRGGGTIANNCANMGFDTLERDLVRLVG